MLLHPIADDDVRAGFELAQEAGYLIEVVSQVCVGHHDVAAPRAARSRRGRRFRSHARARRTTNAPAAGGERGRCRHRTPLSTTMISPASRCRLEHAPRAAHALLDRAGLVQARDHDREGGPTVRIGTGRPRRVSRCSIVLMRRVGSRHRPAYGETSARRKGRAVALAILAQSLGTSATPMRVCLVYDCLFPHTVGGAERWYRSLAERLAADGHEVSYLTLRQWDRGVDPAVPGVTFRRSGRGCRSTAGGAAAGFCRRSCSGPGVLWHLLRHGRRYDVVHTCSFPYFSLLAAAAARGRVALPARGRLVRGVDAGLLARVPGPGRRRRRLAGPAAVRPRAPTRVLLLATLCRAPERRRPCGRGHDPGRGIRRAARARARAYERRAAGACLRAATSPRSACRRSCRRSPRPGQHLPASARAILGDGPDRGEVLRASARARPRRSGRGSGVRRHRDRRGAHGRARSAWCCPRGGRATGSS